MKITIDVTEDDIRAGKAHDCARCAVALAMTRTLGVPVSVGATRATIHHGDHLERYVLPEDATAFIQEFDYAKVWDKPLPKPFSFEAERMAGLK